MRVSPNNASWQWSVSASLCVTTWLQVIPDIIPTWLMLSFSFERRRKKIQSSSRRLKVSLSHAAADSPASTPRQPDCRLQPVAARSGQIKVESLAKEPSQIFVSDPRFRRLPLKALHAVPLVCVQVWLLATGLPGPSSRQSGTTRGETADGLSRSPCFERPPSRKPRRPEPR